MKPSTHAPDGPRRITRRFQQLLLFGDLERKVRRDRVGQLAGSSIWLSETSTSGGIFLLSLMYCSNCVTTERLRASSSLLSSTASSIGSASAWKKSSFSVKRIEFSHAGCLRPAPSRCRRAVSAVAAPYRWCRSHIISSTARIVLSGIFLRHQQDLLVVLHHVFKRFYGLIATDKERHDHVREHNNVPQRKDRKNRCFGGCPTYHFFPGYAIAAGTEQCKAASTPLRWLGSLATKSSCNLTGPKTSQAVVPLSSRVRSA
jgi:hypothetical protein